MRASIFVPLVFGAGALAHPHLKLGNALAHVHHKRDEPVLIKTIIQGGVVDVEDVFVKTVYANGAAPPAPAETTPPPVVKVVAAPAPVITTPAPEPVVVKADYHVQSPPEQPTDTPAPTSTPAPAPTPSPAAPAGDNAPTSGGKSILESANYFRKLQGYPPFEYSSQLEGNAAKTNKDDGGNSMTHELNDGSFAQCIAEGNDSTTSGSWSPFDLIYLGWLCEIPEASLTDACSAMEAATHMLVDTNDPGHAQILRTEGYTKMGCNYIVATEHQPNYEGLWTCDFA